ncbi:MAG: ATP-binding protein [Myxococcota bacterium]|jgi:two-component system sensor histidine kinase RstB|nr:ATP-binding protein [Myxococcota bacterium]
MSRLAVRLSAGILAVIVLSAVIGQCAGERHIRNTAQERARHMSRAFVPLAQDLDSVDRSQRAARLEQRKALFGESLVLLEIPDIDADEGALDELRSGRACVLDGGSESGPRLALPLADGTQALVVGPFERMPHPGWGTLLVLVLLTTLGAVIAGALLAYPVVRRLAVLERAAARIHDGDLSARVKMSAKSDFGSLAETFNAMAARLEYLLETQRQLLQAVSHEFRTPIARLRFGLESLARSDDPDDLVARLDAMDGDLAELDEMVEELLLYARIDAGALPLRREAVEVLELLGDLCEKAEELSPHLHFRILADEDANPVLRADATSLRRAIRNLLNNAAAHARAEVSVSVEVLTEKAQQVEASLRSKSKRGGEVLVLRVDDDGDGVPSSHRERIFEPFARLDESRSRSSGGVGLGLAIVSRVLQSHGARVSVADAPSGGARFEIRWPMEALGERDAAADER